MNCPNHPLKGTWISSVLVPGYFTPQFQTQAPDTEQESQPSRLTGAALPCPSVRGQSDAGSTPAGLFLLLHAAPHQTLSLPGSWLRAGYGACLQEQPTAPGLSTTQI